MHTLETETSDLSTTSSFIKVETLIWGNCANLFGVEGQLLHINNIPNLPGNYGISDWILLLSYVANSTVHFKACYTFWKCMNWILYIGGPSLYPTCENFIKLDGYVLVTKIQCFVKGFVNYQALPRVKQRG